MEREGQSAAAGSVTRRGGRQQLRGECDMGDIGTERREVEFEPLPDEPVTEPARQAEPAPAPAAPART
jgi:hypothetical protein